MAITQGTSDSTCWHAWLWIYTLLIGTPVHCQLGADGDVSTLEISMEVPKKGKGRARTTLQPRLAAP